jgi:carboxypeptidase C (cathepsin A)
LTGGYYEAGHMMYVHQPSLMKLEKDLKEFIRASSSFAPSSAP